MSAYTHPHRRASGGVRQWWPFVGAGAAAIVVAALFIGTFMLGRASSGGSAPAGTTTAGGVSGANEDALVAAAWPYPVPGNLPEPITLPSSTMTTSLGVPTGFPHSPEGALAQLAAVSTAFVEASPDTAKQINAEWLIPGGPGGGDSAAFLADKQQYGSVITYTFNPTMGMIRGKSADGNFVYACVLGNLTGTYAVNGSTKSAPVTSCGRMWWMDGKWLGENKPANALPAEKTPAPGSTTAYQSGWADLR